MALLGMATSPLDIALSRWERKRLSESIKPTKPILLICGPPRSGTTLVGQYLINHLDVAYINNLTSLFPRSPLSVNSLWGARSIDHYGDYTAFYGKSRSLRGVNDGLYIWDRWLGNDRRTVPETLSADAATTMPAFFGHLQALYDKPVVNKVNRLNTCAHLVAPLLPNAVFVFVNRHPLWLAQSLYVARERIGGDLSRAYGTQHPNPVADDPVADVAAQVEWHQRQTRAVISRMPTGQVIELCYETFCAAPEQLIQELRSRVGQTELPLRTPGGQVAESFQVSRARRIDTRTFERLEALTAELYGS